MSERTVNFHCTEGGSDKTYQLRLVADGDGYRVLTQYGPRGGRQTCGEKTKGALPLEQAEKVFMKECKARLAKGYKHTDDNIEQMIPGVTRGVSQKQDSGLRPQLLNAIGAAEASALCYDDNWMMQIKHDGERCLVQIDGTGVIGVNRKGQVRPLPVNVVEAVRALGSRGEAILDGELIGDRYIPFDLLKLDGNDLCATPAMARAVMLTELLKRAGSPLHNHPTAFDTQAKIAMLAQAQEALEEGVVFKHKFAAYEPGRPASGGQALKMKFVETATVRVSGHSAGKRSVAMQVQDETGAWLEVGNCTIPVNHQVPPVGALVEVQYLYYMGRGGALFQPVYRGERPDLEPDACSVDQLKLKASVAAQAA